MGYFEFKEISHKIKYFIYLDKNHSKYQIIKFDLVQKKVSGHQDLPINIQKAVLDKASELFGDKWWKNLATTRNGNTEIKIV